MNQFIEAVEQMNRGESHRAVIASFVTSEGDQVATVTAQDGKQFSLGLAIVRHELDNNHPELEGTVKVDGIEVVPVGQTGIVVFRVSDLGTSHQGGLRRGWNFLGE